MPLKYLTHIREWWRDEYRQRPNWSEKVVVVLTVAIVIVAVVQASIYSRQLDEMKSGGVDTGNLARAATLQMLKTEALRQEMEKSAKATGDLVKSSNSQLEQIKIQAKAARDLASQAQRQASATADVVTTNRQSMEAQERAWIGFGDEPGRVENDVLQYEGEIHNFGHGPAFEISSQVAFEIKEPDFRDFSSIAAKPFTPLAAVVMPGGSAQFHIRYELGKRLPPKMRHDFDTGNLSIYVYGILTYRDIFTRTTPRYRTTQFCTYWNEKKNPRQWYFCNNVYVRAD